MGLDASRPAHQTDSPFVWFGRARPHLTRCGWGGFLRGLAPPDVAWLAPGSRPYQRFTARRASQAPSWLWIPRGSRTGLWHRCRRLVRSLSFGFHPALWLSPYLSQDTYLIWSGGFIQPRFRGADIFRFTIAILRGSGFFSPFECHHPTYLSFPSSTRQRFRIRRRHHLAMQPLFSFFRMSFEQRPSRDSMFWDLISRIECSASWSCLQDLGVWHAFNHALPPSLVLPVYRQRQDSSRVLPFA